MYQTHPHPPPFWKKREKFPSIRLELLLNCLFSKWIHTLSKAEGEENQVVQSIARGWGWDLLHLLSSAFLTGNNNVYYSLPREGETVLFRWGVWLTVGCSIFRNAIRLVVQFYAGALNSILNWFIEIVLIKFCDRLLSNSYITFR